MLTISNFALYSAFIIMLVALVPFSLAVKSKHKDKYNKIAIIMTSIAFVLQIVYFITRWIVAGHAPVSNLYEFVSFFGIMIIGGFLLFNMIYNTPVLGLFAIPIALLVIGYASMFSRDVSPLVPSLQSHWLAIHVITVSISYGVLSISAVAGLIYIIKTTEPSIRNKEFFGIEMIMWFIVTVIAFILITITMRGIIQYEDLYLYTDKNDQTQVAEYHLPAITVFDSSVPVNDLGDNQYEQIDGNQGFIKLPPFINAQKVNTVIWSIFGGSLLYGLIRLFVRKPLFMLVKPWTKNVNIELMDEIGYRSVIIGYPLFALGGLLFAAIWAQEAWSRFWGWDPKETWAFITFMFYTVFLHLRLNKGFDGKKSAWLAVIGMLVILFNLIAVNLIIAGLHSYA